MPKFASAVLWSSLPCLVSTVWGADGPDLPPASQAPIEARYEVLRGTPIGTIRLERFTGQVVREVRNVSGLTSYWEETEYLEAPSGGGNEPRFQIQLDAQAMLLIDTELGKVWRWEPENPYAPTNFRHLWKPFEPTVRAPFAERSRVTGAR